MRRFLIRGLAAVFATVMLVLTPALPVSADPGAAPDAAWEFI